jgi:hypothetical protein
MPHRKKILLRCAVTGGVGITAVELLRKIGVLERTGYRVVRAPMTIPRKDPQAILDKWATGVRVEVPDSVDTAAALQPLIDLVLIKIVALE